MNKYTKLVVFAAIVAGPTLVLAHTGATGIVKKRMDAMKEVGVVMKELGSMARGVSDFDTTTVAKRAGDLKAHAASIPSMFPEGSHHKSEALPYIWEDFEGFSKIASDLETAAATLSTVKDVTALPGALGAAGKTCKSCHSDYRKP